MGLGRQKRRDGVEKIYEKVFWFKNFVSFVQLWLKIDIKLSC